MLLVAATLVPAAPASAWEGWRLAGLFFFRSPLLATAPATIRTHAFTDTAASPARDDFTLLGALGIMRGDGGPDGPVHPEAPVTRAELAAVVVRLLNQETTLVRGWRTLPDPFEDDGDIPGWARPYAVAAASIQVIPWQDRFGAGERVTADEAARVLLAALQWADGGQTWPEAARREARRQLLDRLVDVGPETRLTRQDLAIMVANALRVGHYNPGYFLRGAGYSPQLDYGGTWVRLYRSQDSYLADLYELAPQVFLVGARSLDELAGRRVLALRAVGDNNQVTCLLVAP